jgi:hypothetical protein
VTPQVYADKGIAEFEAERKAAAAAAAAAAAEVSSIIRIGSTFHGIRVESRGVFTHDEHGLTYAGQCKDGHACGLGVTTWSCGAKEYAEHGPDGECDGRWLGRFTDGDTWYYLFERGKEKEERAVVCADGTCRYNGAACAPDDPRVLALIALVAPVEVRPTAQAPHPLLGPPLAPTQSSDGSAGSFCPRRRWRRPLPPRCTPTPHAVAGGRAGTTQRSIALQRTTTQGCVAWTVLA